MNTQRTTCSGAVADLAYSYSSGDFSITKIQDNTVSARTENYVYTPSNRLQETYATWGTLTYYQDGVGNRTSDILNDGTTTTTKNLLYPTGNNLLGSVTQAATTIRTITHDGAGNVITDARGSTTYNYRYNNRGRLDQLTIGSTVTANYSYDGLERMAVRTTQNMTPAATTHYVYDRAGRLLVEASGTGTTQREYVWIDDTPLALFADLDTASPKQWCVHPDHLDRPTKMTDASQTVVWDPYYWPYGGARSITGTASSNLRFPGQYFLVESGLHYNWNRHYDPSLGRYFQPDPIGLVSGPSLYAYVDGNPISETDPSGDCPCPWCIGAAIGAGIELAMQLAATGGNFDCVSWKQVGISAALGAVGGGLGGQGLTAGLKGLSNATKGKIGEALSVMENRLAGSSLVERNTRSIEGFRTKVDSTWDSLFGNRYYVESKFGMSTLTPAQRAAAAAFSDDIYRVERWGYPFFERVGAYVGGTAGGLAGNSGASGGCGCK